MDVAPLAGVTGRLSCLQTKCCEASVRSKRQKFQVCNGRCIPKSCSVVAFPATRRSPACRFLALSVRLTETSVVQSTYVEEPPEREDQDYDFEQIDFAQNGASSSSTDISSVPSDRAELHAIRTNYMRQKLLRKLSEVNQYNRSLQRTVQESNDTLLKCKAELATMELELGVLVNLAQEVAREGGKLGSRKINGRYIQSHLAHRLEDMHSRLTSQIRDVDSVSLRDVTLEWYGVAEDVRVMGSFDGWTEGESLSPEHTGTYAKFSGLLKLRPGNYQIKFVVDGVWQVSPQLATIGEGLTVNNLLVVE
ncbi:protein PTST, chloroplastic-like [Selaginella moellendorffii]|uniref:protein PTST, chloroplastic-like n=1 Tax=Selaginella moellendorffii TaxID=88036 RepID=UPI000D1CBE12|nr:protein PTST, chloroplastic-like [Selaginella moellendorffii]|eukprot:XP_024530514.1 protein PTST, chloroplastic-like [Selaginella moellendorffii]